MQWFCYTKISLLCLIEILLIGCSHCCPSIPQKMLVIGENTTWIYLEVQFQSQLMFFFSWVYPFVVSTAHPSRLYPIKIPLKPMKSPFLKVKLPGSYGFPRVFLSLPLHELRFFTTLPPEVMPPAGRAPSPGARFEVRLPCRPAASASDLWVIVYIYFTSHIIYHNIYIYIYIWYTYGNSGI